jgi:hypothetical protein
LKSFLSNGKSLILVNCKNGDTIILDPRIREDLEKLDSPIVQLRISRVSILTNKGQRVDLPTIEGGYSRVWIETLKGHGEIRGERVCLRMNDRVIKSTLYYSDSRVVIDIF